MKRIFIIAGFLFLSHILVSQDTATSVNNVVKHLHQFKAGASLQYDFGTYYRYDYYYEPYYYDSRYSANEAVANYDGPNTQVFVAYEHIWTYANKMAVGIEPKIGIVFRDNTSKGGFLGASWKYYWVSKDFWRMGLYLNTTYEYNNNKRQIYVSMDGGMYSQLTDITLHQSVFSFDLGFVPFQIMLRSIPMLIELNVNIIGLHVFYTNSNKYDTGNGNTDQYKNSKVGGYGPKIELKIGWQIK